MTYQTLRSPTEFESTPIIAHLMQEYFLKLLGRYREFIEPDRGPADDRIPAPPSTKPELPRPATASSAPSPGLRQHHEDDNFFRQAQSGLLWCCPCVAIIFTS